MYHGLKKAKNVTKILHKFNLFKLETTCYQFLVSFFMNLTEKIIPNISLEKEEAKQSYKYLQYFNINHK